MLLKPQEPCPANLLKPLQALSQLCTPSPASSLRVQCKHEKHWCTGQIHMHHMGSKQRWLLQHNILRSTSQGNHTSLTGYTPAG